MYKRQHVVRDPAAGVLVAGGASTRIAVHSFTLGLDYTPRGTALTVARPLHITLCLRIERDVDDPEEDGPFIDGVIVTSVRLEFASV